MDQTAAQYWLSLAKEILIGIAWPITALIALALFFRPLRSILAALGYRMERALHVEFPWGIKATFAQEREESIKAETDRIIDVVSTALGSTPPPAAREAVTRYIADKQIRDFVIRAVGSRGLLAETRVPEYVSPVFGAGAAEGTPEMIKSLVKEGLLRTDQGTLQLTPAGVDLYRLITYYG